MSDIIVKIAALNSVVNLRKPGYLDAVMSAGRPIANAAGEVVAVAVPPVKYHELRRDYALGAVVGKIPDAAWDRFRVAFLDAKVAPWFDECEDLRREMTAAISDLGDGCAGCKRGAVRIKFARKAWEVYQKSVVAKPDSPA